ncbi:glycosyl transferase family 90-domain-containing protein [Mycena galopus ATCC 62051]|nr:glycosyl transferase family 90-domain-containing protein [Mycena galopus ATCC 62051]
MSLGAKSWPIEANDTERAQSAIFAEYFDDWLRPFEHYIPVRPDLADLVECIEWARAHNAEARSIQRAGREFAERVLTDGQNDCYWFLVLLEWARLQGGGWGDVSECGVEFKWG